MSSRTGSHQLSNGLYVSGRPEQLKERPPTMASRAIIYTGGDVKKSGELGKMYGINSANTGSAEQSQPYQHHQGPPTFKPSSRHSSGSARSGSNSGPMGFKTSGSGPIPKRTSSSSSSFSGPVTPIQPTGLITSGPLGSTGGRRSGRLEPTGSASSKPVYGTAVTTLNEDLKLGFMVSRVALWVFLVSVVMGLVVGGFLMVAVKKAVILVAVVSVVVPALIIIMWNYGYKKRGLLGFLRRYPDAELRGAIDGQYVKVTGVVTCGSIPLESSFQKVSRCVYVSTELYEYKGWGGKSANPTHRCFSWGRRHSEKYVADFYISDFQSGLRALVKAGYGAKVAPLVKPKTVVDVSKDNKELSSSFLSWLSDRSLSSDDRMMRLKEGYIKEGSTVSVMGVVRRQDNVLMIVPPMEPVSTGCQWTRFLLPTYTEGLILLCDENETADVIPV